MAPAAAIYVHLPFCPYICPYCDFAKWAYDDAAAERYWGALFAEIAAAPDLAGTSVFFGGGTPNTYASERIAALLERLRERFAVPPDAEVSLEANPDPALTERLDVLRAAGVNRLSFGVQSFETAELRALGRGHDAGDVRQAVHRARAAGFTNISIDLMFGTPHQTEASWHRSLDAAIALGVEHVSTYGLTIEEGTPYARWHAREPAAFADDGLEAQLYAAAIARLEAAGYEHYEISNFARPGYRCAHNAVYWRNGAYLGLGVGAASYIDGVRSTHTRDLAAYEAAALAGEPIPGSAERLEGDAATGEAIMLALRTSEGVDARAFRERYGIDVLARYAPAVADFTAAGLLAADERGFRLTVRGRFVANDVCAAFL
jgi:oxygen-independent coproporphyrinogen-3 oxidase